MSKENLEVFKTLIVKELTRVELEERCVLLYEKCEQLSDESYLPQVKSIPYLIQYDTNTSGGQDLIMLVYGENYSDAVINLKKVINLDSVFGNISIIKTKNLTIV